MRMRYVFVICVLLSCLTLRTPAQEKGRAIPRTVTIDALPPDAPVRIVKVLLSRAEVIPGVSFQASDDWFDRVEVVVKNTTTKNLVYVGGQLRFPETGRATADHLAVMDRISVGRRPEHARSADTLSREGPSGLRAHVNGAEILLRPGQEIAVPAVDPLDRIEAAMEATQPLSSVTVCEIGIHTLYFDDGSSWLSGLYFRADPRTPGSYVRISQQEFETTRAEKRN